MNNPDPLKNIRIVLSQPSHPGNVGAAARAMKTMGMTDLVLVNPRAFPHPAAHARAAGAIDLLDAARVTGTLDAALTGTVFAAATSSRQREFRHRLMPVREAAQELIAVARSGCVAVVFGNETAGLTREEAGRCQLLAAIPADPDYLSLNLAAAVQVFCYELRVASGVTLPELPPEFEPAAFEDVERFYAHLEQTLVAIDFLDPENPKRLMQRLRRLFARARLEREEVSILRGILGAVDQLRSR